MTVIRTWLTHFLTAAGMIALLTTPAWSSASLSKTIDSGSVQSDQNTAYDLGLVDIQGGMVRKTFDLYNGEMSDLVLKGAFTSCACTKTTIELPDGSLSKPFGMSLPKNWYRVIKPGERFKVHVEFDPAYHGPKSTGHFRRNVYLMTSASPDDNTSSSLPFIKKGTVSTLILSGEVLSSEDYNRRGPVQRFDTRLSDFRFPEKEYDFGVVKQSTSVQSYDVPFIYDGTDPVTVKGTPTSCGCTTASIGDRTLESGDRGVLTIKFDPNFHEEPEGRFFKDVLIITDPPQKEEVSFRIWAEVDLDIGPQAFKFKEHDDEDDHGEEEDGHR